MNDAKKVHGDLLYRMTWRARTSHSRFLWGCVLVLALVRFAWLPFLFLSLLALGIIGQNIGALVTLIPVAFLIILKSERSSMALASSGFSVASDMKRVARKQRREMTNKERVLFFLGGGIAYFLACFVHFSKGKKYENYDITFLDVLGNIFSKTGNWRVAGDIFIHMQKRYLDNRYDQQVAISYALAVKWWSESPFFTENEQWEMKGWIREVLANHPDISNQVKIRLHEALDNTKQVEALRVLIAEEVKS